MLQWIDVTKVQINQCLIDEFGSKETDVSAVLQFGPNRCKKTPKQKLSEFYHVWSDQLPSCMNPDTADSRVRFVDLVKLNLFYFCLDDKYLQQQLCNLKDEDLTLKKL